MSGKMSVGVFSAIRGPTIRINSAMTMKVYGRWSAMRTMPIMTILELTAGKRGAEGGQRRPDAASAALQRSCAIALKAALSAG